VSADPLRVAVLHGGPSREHDISLQSGGAVLRALANAGHAPLPVRIDEDGWWNLEALPGPVSPATALARLESEADAVFVALHGCYGEDGTVQGLLETAGVAYTGSGVAASALAMDKERTKEVLSFHGIESAPWASCDRARWARDPDGFLDHVERELGLPAVVKPPREGSSFGIRMAEDRETLRSAVEGALETPDGRALVERRIAGVEVTCPILGNRGEEWETLPLVEIVPEESDFFDFAAKYEGKSREICPARISEDVAATVREAAVTAHRVLECDGLSRSDFIVDAAGRAWFLETNTVPGMTEQSLCPLSAGVAGLSLADLCDRLVRLAIRRRRLRPRS